MSNVVRVSRVLWCCACVSRVLVYNVVCGACVVSCGVSVIKEEDSKNRKYVFLKLENRITISIAPILLP